ncbi:MAG: hypothetical protein ABIO29_04105 [Sphingomicrobium sp.]
MTKPDPNRGHRLAAALRENLKRRKAQARVHDVEPTAPGKDGDQPS